MLKRSQNVAEAVTRDGVCAEIYFDAERIARAREILPQEESLVRVAAFFRMMADPTRLKIMMAIYDNELCVCDLAGLVGISVSAISHQLRLLREVRLVRFRRQGKMAYYTLDDQHIAAIVSQAREHLDE